MNTQRNGQLLRVGDVGVGGVHHARVLAVMFLGHLADVQLRHHLDLTVRARSRRPGRVNLVLRIVGQVEVVELPRKLHLRVLVVAGHALECHLAALVLRHQRVALHGGWHVNIQLEHGHRHLEAALRR